MPRLPFSNNPQSTANLIPSIPPRPLTSIGLLGSFDKTNLDTTDNKPYGGRPYRSAGDPTMYPVTTLHNSPNRGYFATGGQSAAKFSNQYYSDSSYLDYIKDFI